MGERTPAQERAAMMGKIDRTVAYVIKRADKAMTLSQVQNHMVSAWTELGACIRRIDDIQWPIFNWDGTPLSLERYFAARCYLRVAYYLVATRDKCKMINVDLACIRATDAYETMLKHEPKPGNKRAWETFNAARDLADMVLPEVKE